MTIDARYGTPQFPTVSSDVSASTREAMDTAIQDLQAHKDAWVLVSIPERIAILDTLLKDFYALAPRWIAAVSQAKGYTPQSPSVGEDWAADIWPVLKNLRQVRQVLLDIEQHGRPLIPGPVTTRPDGQVIAQVFPFTPYDRIFFTGVTAEIWMQPEVTRDHLPQTQAVIYQDKSHTGKVALVLGAGNVGSIGPLDILYKLFVEDQVVLFKTNPVKAYLGPVLEEAFRALVEAGYLRIVYGGAAEGAYLCNHAGIEEIHITGSDKTFEAIVFGGGEDGAARKAARQPVLQKRITGELGNVSPVIVVPGPWSASDLAYQAAHIVSMLTTNAGFNCNATRVIIQHAAWQQREALLQQMRRLFAQVPVRAAYYPGAHERTQMFVAEHPEAEQFGSPSEEQLPWTLISGLDAQKTDDICFTTEAFCSLFAETTLEGSTISDYIARAVAFANDHLWGTLNVTLLVHPTTLKDPQVTAAVERAIADLRYGTVALNYWAGTSYTLGVTSWGAFPGHTIYDIQSGTGVVHNTLMFSRLQKSVLRAPFRSIPIPPWFVTRTEVARRLFPKLCAFEMAPSAWKLPGILSAAL